MGAIVLALAAAVIVPMLLESEPKPLGEDVAVKIPPVDDGKFVNRLSTVLRKRRRQLEGRAEETGAARDRRAAEEVRRRCRKGGRRPRGEGRRSTTRRSPAEPATADAASGGRERRARRTGRSRSTIAEERRGADGDRIRLAACIGEASRCAKGRLCVQLAAFSDDKGANALANRLSEGRLSGVHRAARRRRHGTLWRVRVGPYPSRDIAIGVAQQAEGRGPERNRRGSQIARHACRHGTPSPW